MQPDPFGNLRDWGPVMEKVCQLADEGGLSDCQPGLTRILRYRDNWRLREETLKRIGRISNPEDALVRQVLDIIGDENLYYEVRVIACQTMGELLKNVATAFNAELEKAIVEKMEILCSTIQPPILEQEVKKLYSVVREKFHIA